MFLHIDGSKQKMTTGCGVANTPHNLQSRIILFVSRCAIKGFECQQAVLTPPHIGASKVRFGYLRHGDGDATISIAMVPCRVRMCTCDHEERSGSAKLIDSPNKQNERHRDMKRRLHSVQCVVPPTFVDGPVRMTPRDCSLFAHCSVLVAPRYCG